MWSLQFALLARSDKQREKKQKKSKETGQNAGQIHGQPVHKELWNACHKATLPDHCPPLPSAPSPLPQKHGRDVKLPEISCDNKQLLSFEISLYSWTTLIFFLSLTCSQAKPGRLWLSPHHLPHSPAASPPLLLWCASSRGRSVAKLLFLQLRELDPLIVGGQVSNCSYDRIALGKNEGGDGEDTSLQLQ